MSEDPHDNEPTHERFDSDAYAAGGSDADQPVFEAVPSARIVYCTSCGCQLDGLRVGEPCPNCKVPVGSASKTDSKANGKAIAALVLGICSFVGCLLYGLPGMVCGVLAIIFGNKVRRGVAAGTMTPASLGMANAGRVCGIVGLCLSTVYLLAAVAWFVFFFTWMMPQQRQVNQQLQQQMHQMQQAQPLPHQPTPPLPTPTPLPNPTEQESPTNNP